MNPWTGRPPKTRCRAHRSRRPTRACCSDGRPRPARGATAIRSAIATSPASARSAPRAAGSCPATASRTRPGASSRPRVTMPCWSCTRSPATATCAARPDRVIRPRAGGTRSSAPAPRSTPTAGSSSRRTCSAAARVRPDPSSIAPDGYEWASRFPYLTIRDQVAAQVRLADALGIDVWAAVIGGSMGGMHALEWAVGLPDRVERVGILSAPPVEHRRPDRAQLGAARGHPHRSALPGRRVLRRRRRRRPAPRTGARSPHGAAELPIADRAEPAVPALVAVRA